ncbi:uncharacterized protein LOC124461041 [Drosophila willistoni]|uniref:uncharacterized protein LOC124461041 n=1 Tax=Drosophila willistoni TaxID=7260 RepID=UPI001F085087|nr:uncharacterized protein LOC124461041 [Drosophila willistoni]
MVYTCVYLILVSHTLLAFANQLPTDIEKCHYGDTKCLAKSMNYVIKHYGKTGIPALKWPSLSLVNVSTVRFIQDDHSRPIWYDGDIFYTIVKGLENSTVTKVRGFGEDPSAGDSEINIMIPSTITTSKFKFKVNILNIPIMLSGFSTLDTQNIRVKVKMSFVRDNRGYVKVYKVIINAKWDRWIIDLKNIDSENTDLINLVTDWINENWAELFKDAEPLTTQKGNEVVLKLLNDRFSTIRYEDMFLKPNN